MRNTKHKIVLTLQKEVGRSKYGKVNRQHPRSDCNDYVELSTGWRKREEVKDGKQKLQH